MNTNPTVAALLLERGADPAARNDNGETPCQLAVANNAGAETRDLLCQ